MPPDNKIGRFISDTVASLPKLSPQDFDKLVNDGLQVVFLLPITLISNFQVFLPIPFPPPCITKWGKNGKESKNVNLSFFLSVFMHCS